MSRYLTEEEVSDTKNPFVQLLSGVVWLIRNGSVYINESQAAECEETQETGGARWQQPFCELMGSCGKAFNKYYSGYRESGIKTDKVLVQYIREKIDI